MKFGKKLICTLLAAALCLSCLCGCMRSQEEQPQQALQSAEDSREASYQKAVALMDAGDYEAAYAAFQDLIGYKDTDARLAQIEAILAAPPETTAPSTPVVPPRRFSQTATLAASAYHTVGIRADGTVLAAGMNTDGQCNVSGWANIVAVAAGSHHTVGIRDDGTVVATGLNESGQCNVSGWTNIVAIAAGLEHTVGVRSDGTVVAAGANDYGQCDVSGWTNIVAVGATRYHTVGLRGDGTVVMIGQADTSALTIHQWSDIAAITAFADRPIEFSGNPITKAAVEFQADAYAAGLRSDGALMLPREAAIHWSNLTSVAFGGHLVGLRTDGTVIVSGDNAYGEANVSEWTDIVAVAAGSGCTFGLRADGTVMAAGLNDYGQCDVSGWTNIRTS